MNTTNLKSYAPRARLDFIKAVTERANVLGISAAGVIPAEVRGDIALIDGREWPAKVAGQRDALIARIKRHGFEQTMDEVAYTWFNRFAALRYMEIHDYLGHGWRVLSSRDGGLPEILHHASEVALPGLSPDRAREMQLAGHQDNELYKLLLVAQCNELSRVMPFLFERIDDETELLLPENLLRTDSIVAKLVEQVPEEDWQEIEVIGWLYQFYISEKKDQVIGKVVKSEDIPAATQLFTPNWIVQYMVQNSVGRLWLMANPTSTLASQWPYYIQPAEQTPEVQAQLDALIQTRIREDGETLNPETITVLDPACGSGHILVVAYDVLKAIYLERGYQPRSIPRLILEKNLYGLDIDARAGQLAAFALMMKARADDRRLFSDPPKLNVQALLESKGLDVDELAIHLAPFGVERAALKSLLDTFEHAKTFGSLIQLAWGLDQQLAYMPKGLQHALQEGDLYARQAAEDVLPLVWQALLLVMKFDAVVANPPYMGGKYFPPVLKSYVGRQYEPAKGDLYTCFMVRSLRFMRDSGILGMITIPNWMFLSSYEGLRAEVLDSSSIHSMLHNGRGVFGSDFGSCAFVLRKGNLRSYVGVFRRLFDKQGSVSSNSELRDRFFSVNESLASTNDFNQVPGQPIAYWISDQMRASFSKPLIGAIATTRKGMVTANNDLFVRTWSEVSFAKVNVNAASREAASASLAKWFPYIMGGDYRKWYGNRLDVVNWAEDGNEIRSKRHPTEDRIWATNFNLEFVFKPNINWNSITAAKLAFRASPGGELFASTGLACFVDGDGMDQLLGFLNSKVCESLLLVVAPTLSANPGDIGRLPFSISGEDERARLSVLVREAISISKIDWDSFEISWDYLRDPIVLEAESCALLAESWHRVDRRRAKTLSALRTIEEEINAICIESYGLSDEVTKDVPENEITVARGDREKDCQRLVSYAIGCMMGRYSLDELGLVYACSGNIGFEPGRYRPDFPADGDGIIPLTDERWFEDDSASRVRDFLQVVWGAEALEENIAWLSKSLGSKGSETPDETVRRYLADKFYKDHLQTYKKRPIYWLFSSGKQGAFQALVYLHRYNEGTLARIRAEYVVPLIAKMASRLDMLNQDVAAASSAAARTKLQKQIESLRKKQIELLAYDEKLRHYADMRITLDLDDGVKANYAKFGDLVAESKAICGGKDED
ncbi:BREX-1 system adenine-specific DNA-methyltransferase PglX [Inhella sp.]|uniref:BREX-1 system adenine-specific DNA-methyltransferase PglX n=1 Tax=Inhella sp. TaxID=1921806 RepID=UPI0035B38916